MTGGSYLWDVILVMTVTTFATRAFPFVALRGKGEHPILRFLSRYMPPVIMTILVLYSLKSIEPMQAPYGANELIALAITSATHLWRSNALLSIFTGTLFYMAAVQQGFWV